MTPPRRERNPVPFDVEEPLHIQPGDPTPAWMDLEPSLPAGDSLPIQALG